MIREKETQRVKSKVREERTLPTSHKRSSQPLGLSHHSQAKAG